MKKTFEKFYKENFNEINKTVKIFAIGFTFAWFIVLLFMLGTNFIYFLLDTEMNEIFENFMSDLVWPGVTITALISEVLFFIHLIICEKLNLSI